MKKLLLFLFTLLVMQGSQVSAQCAAMFMHFVNSTTPPVVSFVDSSFGSGPITYQWNFGDGSPVDTQQFPVHTFPSNGIYTVCLTISDSLGCIDTACATVDITLPTPTVTLYYFDADSLGFYHCTSPASVGFMYYGIVSGFLPTDSFLIDINFGDGIDSSYYVHTTSGIQGFVTHTYQNGGTYSAQMLLTAPNGMTDTLQSNTIIVSSTCGSVSGYAYNDLNGNCVFDSGEELGNISLTIYNGTSIVGWTYTDSTGLYSFNVPTGATYEIHVNTGSGPSNPFAPSCPSSGILTVSTVPSTGNNFGLVCPPGYDLQGNITGWGFRPGFTATVCVSVYNQRCYTPSGQIEVTFPNGLTPQPDSSGSYTISGNVVTYPIDSAGHYWTFCIPVAVSSSLAIGDTICVDLNILPVTGDSVPSNNTGTFCFPVRNSWDPNDKYATPAGEDVQGYVLPNTTLTYTIRFQNTGNAEAINIYILDTLNSYLDAGSLEFLGSSHPTVMTLLSGNVLRFNFDNINLPDSNSNEPASHGYVTYRIDMVSGIPQLGEITNTAGIYFDFNPPVITNTTLHTVDMFLSVTESETNTLPVTIYPNPAGDFCKFSFEGSGTKTIVISDLTGKEVFHTRINENSWQLSTDKFADGIYTVRISDSRNFTNISKLMISR